MEIDTDGNNTIDFYEYMKVADMLLNRNGTANYMPYFVNFCKININLHHYNFRDYSIYNL